MSSGMVEALDWVLPMAHSTEESSIVMLDWFSGHLTDEVAELIRSKGHVLLFHGGGTTPFTQINDTHLQFPAIHCFGRNLWSPDFISTMSMPSESELEMPPDAGAQPRNMRPDVASQPRNAPTYPLIAHFPVVGCSSSDRAADLLSQMISLRQMSSATMQFYSATMQFDQCRRRDNGRKKFQQWWRRYNGRNKFAGMKFKRKSRKASKDGDSPRADVAMNVLAQSSGAQPSTASFIAEPSGLLQQMLTIAATDAYARSELAKRALDVVFKFIRERLDKRFKLLQENHRKNVCQRAFKHWALLLWSIAMTQALDSDSDGPPPLVDSSSDEDSSVRRDVTPMYGADEESDEESDEVSSGWAARVSERFRQFLATQVRLCPSCCHSHANPCAACLTAASNLTGAQPRAITTLQYVRTPSSNRFARFQAVVAGRF